MPDPIAVAVSGKRVPFDSLYQPEFADIARKRGLAGIEALLVEQPLKLLLTGDRPRTYEF
jgi:hypothetical protein